MHQNSSSSLFVCFIIIISIDSSCSVFFSVAFYILLHTTQHTHHFLPVTLCFSIIYHNKHMIFLLSLSSFHPFLMINPPFFSPVILYVLLLTMIDRYSENFFCLSANHFVLFITCFNNAGICLLPLCVGVLLFLFVVLLRW